VSSTDWGSLWALWRNAARPAPWRLHECSRAREEIEKRADRPAAGASVRRKNLPDTRLPKKQTPSPRQKTGQIARFQTFVLFTVSAQKPRPAGPRSVCQPQGPRQQPVSCEARSPAPDNRSMKNRWPCPGPEGPRSRSSCFRPYKAVTYLAGLVGTCRVHFVTFRSGEVWARSLLSTRGVRTAPPFLTGERPKTIP